MAGCRKRTAHHQGNCPAHTCRQVKTGGEDGCTYGNGMAAVLCSLRARNGLRARVLFNKGCCMAKTREWLAVRGIAGIVLAALVVPGQEVAAQDVRDLLRQLLPGEAVNTGAVAVGACASRGSPYGNGELCADFEVLRGREYAQSRSMVVASTGEVARSGFCEDPSDQFSPGRGRRPAPAFAGCGQILGRSGVRRAFVFPGCPQVPIRSDTIPDPDPYRGPEIRTETNDCVNGSPMRVRIEATRTPVVFEPCTAPSAGCVPLPSQPTAGWRLVTPGEWEIVFDGTVTCERRAHPEAASRERGHTVVACGGV